MAQQKSNDNYDALGSIFDFIFKESKKPADKRRSVKPTDLTGESNLVDALVATLELPGAFITDSGINELNTALDFQIADIGFGDRGGIKISTKNLVDVLKDPGGFVDKQMQRAQSIRKAQRVRMFGEFMDDYLTTAWAHKYGNLEAKKIALANGSANERAESHIIGRAVGQSVRGFDSNANRKAGTPGGSNPLERDFMLNRSVDLLGERTFGQKWFNMGKDEKADFVKILTGTDELSGSVSQSVAMSDVQKFLVKKYGKKEAMNFGRAMDWKGFDKNAANVVGNVDILDPEFYRFLENDNLTGKINSLKNAAPGSEEEKERKIYEKTKLLVNLRVESQIKDLEKKLKDPNLSQAHRDKIQRAIDDAKEAKEKVGGRGAFIGKIGRWEGYLGSLNTVYGGVLSTNVMGSILSGDFFDKGKNTVFNPVEERSIKDDRGEKYKDFDVKIYRAKRVEGKGSKFINAYNEMGENLYYMTPRSIVRTIFYNGEGFVRLLDKNIEALKKMGVSPEDIVAGTINKLSDADIEDILNKSFSSLNPKDREVKKKKLQEMMKDNKRFAGLAKRHGRLFSIQEKIKGKMKKRMQELRVSFARKLLKNATIRKWIVKSGASKLLGNWIVSGGVKTLVRSLVTAAAGALGMALTPLGSIVIMAVTALVTDGLMKLAKVALNTAKWALLGVLCIIILIISMGHGNWRRLNKISFADQNVIPGKVVSCEAYGYGNIAPTPFSPIIVPPPTGETCVFGTTASIRCTQGWVDDGTCFSHAGIASAKPVDLGYSGFIYAPQFCSNPRALCKITSSGPYPCSSPAGSYAVMSAFDGQTTYVFEMVHIELLGGLSTGSTLSGGQPVAKIITSLPIGSCWTGPHLHLEVKQNGSVVDPLALLQSFNCNVPSLSGCSGCKGN